MIELREGYQMQKEISVRNDFPLSTITWFKVGGPAKFYARPKNYDELSYLLTTYGDLIVLGNASNVLISDSPIEQCIVKLSSAFGRINRIGETTFEIGSACLDSAVALYMQSIGISGMEFLATIPGTIGGNIAMNAGCFGSEIFDIIKSVTVMEKNGKISTLQKNEIPHSYRHAVLPENSIILSAVIEGKKSNPDAVQQTIDNFVQQRMESQPQNVRTGGSTFKNPEGHKAWELIRLTGANKLKVGGAAVSAKHSNFLINTGNATAHDIYTLGEMIRERVLSGSGIDLEWEIKMIGAF